MDLLDLHRLLFPWPASCQRVDERIHYRRPRSATGTGPDVPGRGVAWPSAGFRGPEYYRAEYRQVATERRRRGHLSAPADACDHCGDILLALRIGNPIHDAQYDACMELGYGQLLVADRICLHRS